MNSTLDPHATYLLRWRGRQQGPFTLAQIEINLADNAIGMLHEIQVQGEWLTLRNFFDQIDAERRAEAERLAEAERRAEAERLAAAERAAAYSAQAHSAQPDALRNRPKAADEAFCPSCGSPIKIMAVFCPHCGVANARHSPSQKSKTAAVLLAVFLGFWTWCYTYKRDAWKFWVSLVLHISTYLISQEGLAYGLAGWYLFCLISWIWAVIDVAVKSEDFYSKYPNKQ